MFLVLVLLFVVLPVVEWTVLVRISQAIDFGPTLAVVVLTGVIGAALAKHQGLRALARIQENLARGTMPGKEMVDGLLILLAGAVLITPGVITDGFGFILLIPPTRALVRKAVTRYFKKRMVIVPPADNMSPAAGNDFIDVEASETPNAASGGMAKDRPL